MTLQKDSEGSEKKHLHKLADFTNKRVLEIGCGEGRLTWRYAETAKNVVGIDPDRNSLRVASYDRRSDLERTVHFANARAEHLPFRKETFDIALLAWSL
jgi:ubiquinone/menaquinone biosynthesis C-methylase UbiE